MTDYTKLVKALRLCASQTCCDNCPRFDNGLDPYECTEKLYTDAAAAIEELQAENEKLRDTITIQDAALHPNPRYVEPKRGEWIWMQKANGGQYKGCSVCHAPIPTDSMLDYLDDEDCDFCYSCGAKMEVQE